MLSLLWSCPPSSRSCKRCRAPGCFSLDFVELGLSWAASSLACGFGLPIAGFDQQITQLVTGCRCTLDDDSAFLFPVTECCKTVCNILAFNIVGPVGGEVESAVMVLPDVLPSKFAKDARQVNNLLSAQNLGGDSDSVVD